MAEENKAKHGACYRAFVFIGAKLTSYCKNSVGTCQWLFADEKDTLYDDDGTETKKGYAYPCSAALEVFPKA
jgi:hypothetical protein